MQGQKFVIGRGTPLPLGATPSSEGINFSIHVAAAEEVALRLYPNPDKKEYFEEIQLDPSQHQTGEIWHVFLKKAPLPVFYLFRVKKATNDWLLIDPYAKELRGHFPWRAKDKQDAPFFGAVSTCDFDWEGDKPLKIPLNELIIYETHIRGFTNSPSSEVQNPGSYLGFIEKIPHLKKLGINAVELLPIHVFNECEVSLKNPKTHEMLCNYFGYSTINFFSPMDCYATAPGKAREELKTLIKTLHKNGIEVILDVVYNHTFEGGDEGITQCYRGLNSPAYYMLAGEGHHLNFSGCGNTFNCNHPISVELILASLRYWTLEYHIDGFRFDLASILNRDLSGKPLSYAPVVKAISMDPFLKETKLIAEAWDAAGFYQVGHFAPTRRWSEWNGKYRDAIRRFIKGTPHTKTAFATAICGSQDLYGWRKSPLCSINFVTCHDGFSLKDLVSYNTKHNEVNGENNQDGTNENESWNCGFEGETENDEILKLRLRQMKNFHLALMISQGVPMLFMGDEYGHTKKGNNNTWCQDNALNWFEWNELEQSQDFFCYYSSLIHFRKKHPLFSKNEFLNEKTITWHGLKIGEPEWENDNKLVAFTLNDDDGKPLFYVAFNASELSQTVALPETKWESVIDTSKPSPWDFLENQELSSVEVSTWDLPPYSAILLKQEAVL